MARVTALEKKREEVKENEEAEVPFPDIRPAEASELVRHAGPPELSVRQEVTSGEGGGARRAKLQRGRKTSEKVSGVMMVSNTVFCEIKHTDTTLVIAVITWFRYPPEVVSQQNLVLHAGTSGFGALLLLWGR